MFNIRNLLIIKPLMIVLKNKIIYRSFMHSLIFSIPLYFCIFTYIYNISLPYINSIFVICSIYTFINIPRNERYLFGFFVGIFWFYWVGLSFFYTPFPIFGIFAVIVVSFFYMIIFLPILFFENKLYRGISLALISYVALFNFEWFVPDSILAFSIFKVDKLSFLIIILIVVCISYKFFMKWRFISLFGLLFAIDFNSNEVILPDINIYTSSTNISQDIKWLSTNINNVIDININLIKDAISNNYDVILLPETAFPVALNDIKNYKLLENIANLSRNISIITGSYRVETNDYYNSTYVFNNGKVDIIDKVVLAPFGEYIPLPKFLISLYQYVFKINYKLVGNKSRVAQDFYINNISFRNAICYEGGIESAYFGNPRYMTLISNNAWFKPSIEPILQMMLIKYFSRKYDTIVFHSTNGSKANIILPRVGLSFYNNSKFL